jgi:hypothetical protein
MRKSAFLLSLGFLAATLCSGCGSKEATPAPPAAASKPAASSSSGNPIDAPANYLGGLAKSKTLAEKTSENAALNQSVQLFYAQEGRYPKTLDELVTQKYLPRIPAPPNGMKITYDAATGQVKVVPAQ